MFKRKSTSPPVYGNGGKQDQIQHHFPMGALLLNQWRPAMTHGVVPERPCTHPKVGSREELPFWWGWSCHLRRVLNDLGDAGCCGQRGPGGGTGTRVETERQHLAETWAAIGLTASGTLQEGQPCELTQGRPHSCEDPILSPHFTLVRKQFSSSCPT